MKLLAINTFSEVIVFTNTTQNQTAPSFHNRHGQPNSVAITPEVYQLIENNCVVAVGVSGGKDSVACAIAVDRYLTEVGHTGPKILIHADLGRVEWKDSLPSCERLAEKIGWELVVVQRKAGDMLARWQGRWANNVTRYQDLSCVKLILPWSTPSMRFCTSELKVAVITSALRKRFPTEDILNVTGIRHQESANRSRMPISAALAKLQRRGAAGISWNAIIEWPVEAVFQEITDAGLDLHQAYRLYGSTRVSCTYCIMASWHDLLAAANCPDNRDILVDMVTLELDSSFSFQSNFWLADVAPQLLPEEFRSRIEESKLVAEQRKNSEAELPKHLLFTSGWPTSMPSMSDAELIASVRVRISGLLGFDSSCLTADSVLARYDYLLHQKSLKAQFSAI